MEAVLDAFAQNEQVESRRMAARAEAERKARQQAEIEDGT